MWEIETVHPVEEFGDFPWDKLDEKTLKGCGTFCHHKVRGHYFAFLKSLKEADIWIIPIQLHEHIVRSYERIEKAMNALQKELQ